MTSFTGRLWHYVTRIAIVDAASTTAVSISHESRTWRSTVQEAINGKFVVLRSLLEGKPCLGDVIAFIVACYLPKKNLNSFVKEPKDFLDALRAIAPLVNIPERSLAAYVLAIKNYADNDNISKALDETLKKGPNGGRDRTVEDALKQQDCGLTDWVAYCLGRDKKYRVATMLDGVSHFMAEETDDRKQIAAAMLEWAIKFAAEQIDDQAKRSAWLSSCNSRLSILTNAAYEDHGIAVRRLVQVARIRDVVGILVLNGLHASHGRDGEGGRTAPFTNLLSLMAPEYEGQTWRLQVTLHATIGDMILDAERGGYLQDMFAPLLYESTVAVCVIDHGNNIDKILDVQVDFLGGFNMNRQFWG